MKLTLSTLLAIAVLAVLWWTVGQGEPLPSLARKQNDNIVEMYVSDFSQWTFGDNGALIDTVHIAESHQYSQDPRVYFSTLQAIHSDEIDKPWMLTAGKGVYRPHTSEVWLQAGVKIENKHKNNNWLETPRLKVLKKENRAFNDANVKLAVDNSLTTGRGLEVDLETKVAQILENVETIYAD